MSSNAIRTSPKISLLRSSARRQDSAPRSAKFSPVVRRLSPEPLHPTMSRGDLPRPLGRRRRRISQGPSHAIGQLEVLADQKEIQGGVETPQGDGLGAVVVGDGPHLQVVRDHDPVVPHALSQQGR